MPILHNLSDLGWSYSLDEKLAKAPKFEKLEKSEKNACNLFRSKSKLEE